MSNKMSKNYSNQSFLQIILPKLKHLINPSRIFLFLLIFLTLWNCFLSLETRKSEIIQQNYKLNTSSSTQNNKNITNSLVKERGKNLIKGRIIASKMDNFGVFEYTIWSQNEFWNGIGSANKVLEIGKNYVFEGQIKSFEFDQSGKKFANYDLSLGITGVIEIEKANAEQNCDLECFFWQKLNQTRRNWQNFYQNELCGSFKQVNNWLSGGECSNVWGLSNGLIIGGTDKFDSQMKQNFRTLGLSHLVAVSGFQVVLLISILEIFLAKLELNRKVKFALGILGIVLLVLIAGPQPPVLRSSLSFLISQSVLVFFERRISSLRVLIYSSLILLILNPFYLISVSFQLSFMASFGLVLGFGTDSIASFLVKEKIENSTKTSNQNNFEDSSTNNSKNNPIFSSNLASNCSSNSNSKKIIPSIFDQNSDKTKTNNQFGNKDGNKILFKIKNLLVKPLINSSKKLTNQNENNTNSEQFHEVLSRRFQFFWQFFVELFFATFNSFLFTLPIIINLSGQISPIAILTNLLIVPIIPFLTYFNLLALIPFLGIFPLFLAGIIQSLLILLINELSNFGLIWRISSFENWEFVLYYSVLITFSIFLKFRNK